MPIWAAGHIAIPGRREQETSGHGRALGYDGWLRQSPTFLASSPWIPPPHHPRLLSCLQLRVRSVPSTHYRATWMAGSSWPPTDSPVGDPGPHSRHLCCTMGREVGTVQVSKAGPPQAGKVLASLEQYVPSVLGHGGHSQSPGAATSSPKWWVVGSAQGNCVGGPWGSVPHRSGWGPQPPYF